jgi:hypothetical protein
MKKIVVAALVASGLVAAPAYAGPTVTVRVEGQNATLLERTRVTLPDTPSTVQGCEGTRWTVADAIDVATNGNWDRDDFIQTILGETHEFADSDYWAQWNGEAGAYSYSQTGVCETVMDEGDEVLMLVDRTPPPTFASTSFPLGLRGVPAAVQAGTPVIVSVVTFAADGTASPVDGATVAGGGATATTGADGRAVIGFPQPGSFAVKATKPGSVPSAGESVAVSATPVPPRASPTALTRPDDKTAPRASFARLTNGKVYKRRKAPRRIAGSVTADPSGLQSVRLSILRRVGDRCWTYDGESERFERHRCGGRDSFRIGDRADWSYLLPERLGKGRYTIRAVAIDKAGNDSATRVVIRVR